MRGNMIPMRNEEGDIVSKQILKKRMVRKPDGKWHEEEIQIEEPVPYDLLPKVFEDFKIWFTQYKNEL